MPNIGERKKLDLSSAKNKKREATQQAKGSPAPPPAKPKQTAARQPKVNTSGKGLFDDDDDDDELSGEDGEDEVISAAVKGKAEGNNKLIMIGGGAVVLVIVFVLFIIFFSGRRNRNTDVGPAEPEQGEEQQTEEQQPEVIRKDPSVGTQDFTQNTNNTSNSPLTNPDDFVKDIYGLTTRANYDVAEIQSAADMVAYTKHRGTWGGGLELYYLDVTYKEQKYVIQVPFQYYKELDDTGIIPVKMEVLRIRNETGDGYLTVISYMCLDEATLKSILKTQSK